MDRALGPWWTMSSPLFPSLVHVDQAHVAASLWGFGYGERGGHRAVAPVFPSHPRLGRMASWLVEAFVSAPCSMVHNSVTLGPPKWGDHDGAHGESTTASTGAAWGLTVGLGAAG